MFNPKKDRNALFPMWRSANFPVFFLVSGICSNRNKQNKGSMAVLPAIQLNIHIVFSVDCVRFLKVILGSNAAPAQPPFMLPWLQH